MLLETTIEDLKAGRIKIITKYRKTKGYYLRERKMKPKKLKFYYAVHENGDKEVISRNILKMYQEVLANNL